jgi:hypothetical protein
VAHPGSRVEIRVVANIGLGGDAHTADRPERRACANDDLVSRYVADTDNASKRFNVKTGLV